MTHPNSRTADYPIDSVFTERWSPRSLTGEDIPVDVLNTILEAGRWAPSAYNSQPWRFVWARRGTPHFETFLNLLVPGNQSWAKDASALVFLVSSKTMTVPGKDEPVPSRSHSADAGAAWMSVALQAHKLDWATHGMIGFDYEAAARELRLPEGFQIEIAIAVGRRGDPARLPDGLRVRELPNDRRPLRETAFEGAFPA